MHYSDLNALLHSEQEAKRYFDTLPDCAREQIQTRSGNVNSFASLKDYAENLLRGDDWQAKRKPFLLWSGFRFALF